MRHCYNIVGHAIKMLKLLKLVILLKTKQVKSQIKLTVILRSVVATSAGVGLLACVGYVLILTFHNP